MKSSHHKKKDFAVYGDSSNWIYGGFIFTTQTKYEIMILYPENYYTSIKISEKYIKPGTKVQLGYQVSRPGAVIFGRPLAIFLSVKC